MKGIDLCFTEVNVTFVLSLNLLIKILRLMMLTYSQLTYIILNRTNLKPYHTPNFKQHNLMRLRCL